MEIQLFSIKDMHCRQVLTFLLSPIEWLTFCQNWWTCYYFLQKKKLNFHFWFSPIFRLCLCNGLTLEYRSFLPTIITHNPNRRGRCRIQGCAQRDPDPKIFICEAQSLLFTAKHNWQFLRANVRHYANGDDHTQIGQYPKIGTWKKWDSVFPVKDMHCQQVLTFL